MKNDGCAVNGYASGLLVMEHPMPGLRHVEWFEPGLLDGAGRPVN